METNSLKSLALFAIISVTALQGAVASVVITGSAIPGTVSQMPGSATDYDLFTSSSDLTNFTVTPYTNPLYTSGNTSLITPGPLGTSVSTGVVWQYDTSQVFSFSLGSSPTYDYSDFYVNILYGNSNAYPVNPATPFDNTKIGLGAGLNDGSGTFVSVDDTNTSPTKGAIVQFHITGAAAGDTFTLGATTPEFLSYNIDFGGISFQQTATVVPEPATWAMLLAGVVSLVGLQRFKRRA